MLIRKTETIRDIAVKAMPISTQLMIGFWSIFAVVVIVLIIIIMFKIINIIFDMIGKR